MSNDYPCIRAIFTPRDLNEHMKLYSRVNLRDLNEHMKLNSIVNLRDLNEHMKLYSRVNLRDLNEHMKLYRGVNLKITCIQYNERRCRKNIITRNEHTTLI